MAQFFKKKFEILFAQTHVFVILGLLFMRPERFKPLDRTSCSTLTRRLVLLQKLITKKKNTKNCEFAINILPKMKRLVFVANMLFSKPYL